MESRNLITNPRNTRGSIVPPEVPEEAQKNGPSPAEIRQRAFEIHIERGGIHGCELDDWQEAERELQQKYENEVQNRGKDSKRKREPKQNLSCDFHRRAPRNIAC
jgi:hypothetical protein